MGSHVCMWPRSLSGKHHIPTLVSPAINIYQLSGGQTQGEGVALQGRKTDRLRTVPPIFKEN